MAKPKFQGGDKVKIIGYGSLLPEPKGHPNPLDGKKFPIIRTDEKSNYRDLQPKLVGQEGIVLQAVTTQEGNKYRVQVGGKTISKLFNEEQLQKQ